MAELASTHNLPEYSVSEIAVAIKQSVEDRFGVVRVRGEITGWKPASSGHCYFRLKDENAVLDAVCWRGTVAKFTFKPEDGLEVVARGKVTTYPGKSSYQIVVDALEPAGAGALMALLEKRKAALAKEGLFDPARKKPIPFLPQTIGVITSPTGAVIRDILHRIDERFPVHVIVWPVAVQGDGAAEQIAAAIEGFNKLASPPDLLIVGRGGGSLEDLWAFNEEIVVRAAATSRIPLISAVGHETDTTLIDYASDRRAPTPTAAAEMAVPVREELLLTLASLHTRARAAWLTTHAHRQEKLAGFARGLPRPEQLLAYAAQRLDDVGEHLRGALAIFLEQKQSRLNTLAARIQPFALKQRLQHHGEQLQKTAQTLQYHMLQIIHRKQEELTRAAALLEALNYHATLKRGFALVKDAKGKLITSVKEAKNAKELEIVLHDGNIAASVK